jgi:hypothetical protein
LRQPGAAGKWSVRDILAHISTWDAEALKALPVILAEKKTPLYSALYGGVDQFNRQEHERKSRLSLAEVKQELADVHRQLVTYLQTAPEKAFTPGTRFQRRLRSDSYAHYLEHARSIAEWKARRSGAR